MKKLLFGIPIIFAVAGFIWGIISFAFFLRCSQIPFGAVTLGTSDSICYPLIRIIFGLPAILSFGFLDVIGKSFAWTYGIALTPIIGATLGLFIGLGISILGGTAITFKKNRGGRR